MKQKRKIKFWHVLVLLLLFMMGTVILDSIRNSKFESIPERPDPPITLEHNQLYYKLVNDSANIDWAMLNGALEYVRGEYDCSDFRLVNLVRILYEYGDEIPEAGMQKYEEVLLNFRYWWDKSIPICCSPIADLADGNTWPRPGSGHWTGSTCVGTMASLNTIPVCTIRRTLPP